MSVTYFDDCLASLQFNSFAEKLCDAMEKAIAEDSRQKWRMSINGNLGRCVELQDDVVDAIIAAAAEIEDGHTSTRLVSDWARLSRDR